MLGTLSPRHRGGAGLSAACPPPSSTCGESQTGAEHDPQLLSRGGQVRLVRADPDRARPPR